MRNQIKLDKKFFSLKNSQKLLWVIIPLAILVRVIYQLQLSATPFFSQVCLDPEYYHKWALSIVKNGLFYKSVFWGNPLYPYFLAGVYLICGVRFLIIRLIQHCMGVLTCVLVYRIGARWFSKPVGIVGCILLAFYPATIFYEGSLVIATLALLLHTLAIWMIAEWNKKYHGWRWLVIGILFGLAYTARGSGIVFAVPVWIFLYLKEFSLRKRVLQIGLYCVGICIAILPFSLHNYFVGGQWALTTSHWGETFYVGNNLGANGGNTQPEFVRAGPFTEHEDFRLEAQKRTGREMSLEESSEYWFGQAGAFIKKYPVRFLKLLLLKSFYFVQGFERPDNINIYFLRDKLNILRFPLIPYGVIIALALWGMGWSVFHSKRRSHKLLLMLYVFYAVSVVLFFITSRYRVPVISIAVLFAGYALVTMGNLLKKRKIKFFISAVLMILSVGIVLNVCGSKNLNIVIECNRIGTLYNKTAQPEKAYTWYKRAYRLDSSDALTKYNLGIVARELNRHEEAVTWFKRALIRNRFPDKAMYELAATYFQMNNLTAAVKILESAMRRDSDDDKVLNLLAICYAGRNRFDAAQVLWEKIVRLNPDYIDAQYNLGILWLHKGDPIRARNYLYEVKKHNPNYKSLRKFLKQVR